jgi:hypothetical protein
MLVVFAALRTWRVIGRPIARFNDTAGYLEFDPFGSGARFWPVTLPFDLLANDISRVVAHLVVAVGAWGFLAWVVTEPIRGRHRWAAPLVLLVGLTDPASRFDITILSESLGLSYAIAAMGSWIWLVRRRDRLSGALVIATTGLFGMTRNTHVGLLVVITIIALIFWFFREPNRFRGAIVGALSVLSLFGLLLLASNHSMTNLVMYYTVAQQVLHDEAAIAWYADRGMPVTDEILSAAGGGFVYRDDLPPELATLLDLPESQPPPTLMLAGGMELARWMRASGKSTYVSYLLAHPSRTISVLTSRTDLLLNPTYLLPLAVRPLIPPWVFAPWQWCVVAILASAAAAGHRKWDAATYISLATLALAVFWFSTVALAGPGTEQRVAVTLAVVIRAAAVVAVIGALAARTVAAGEDPA